MSITSSEPISPRDRWVVDDAGAIVGIRPARSARTEARLARWSDDDGALLTPDGAAMTLTEAAELGSNITATGAAYTGSGYFVGVLVSAYSGGPQTIVARDSTDASGRILATFTVSSGGTYRVDGDWSTPGSGGGLRIKIDAGVHLTISGGTSRTVAAIVGV